MKETYVRKAMVVRVVDGDTVELNIDLGCHIHVNEICRLSGINAPETRGAADKAPGLAAKAHLVDIIHPYVTIKMEKDQGKFGRYLVTIWNPGDREDGPTINDRMVTDGHAVRAEY